MGTSLRDKVLSGTIWQLLDQVSAYLVNLVMGIILARLLTPNDYGTVALISIFITVGMVLVNAGLGQALVQKRDATDEDFDTILIVSVSIALLLYGILFITAPSISKFYRNPLLVLVLRLLSLNLILNAITSVQSAELYKRMRFDLSFYVSITSALTSAVVGVGMALAGYGVWALVWSAIISGLMAVTLRSFLTVWKPRFRFDRQRLVPLLKFGWKMMVASLLGTSIKNLYGIVIGRWYSAADLAFVNKGRNIPELVMESFNSAVIGASFPALVQLQNDHDRMRQAIGRFLSISTAVFFPLVCFLAVNADDIIILLYGEQWKAAVPYAQLTCMMLFLSPISATFIYGLLALGRSDKYLKVRIIEEFITVAVLIACISKGVLVWYVAYSLMMGPFVIFVDTYPARKLLAYPMTRMFREVFPGVVFALVVAASTIMLKTVFRGETPIDMILRLVSAAVSAALFVLATSLVCRFAVIGEILSMVQERFNSRGLLMQKMLQYFGRK